MIDFQMKMYVHYSHLGFIFRSLCQMPQFVGEELLKTKGCVALSLEDHVVPRVSQLVGGYGILGDGMFLAYYIYLTFLILTTHIGLLSTILNYSLDNIRQIFPLYRCKQQSTSYKNRFCASLMEK